MPKTTVSKSVSESGDREIIQYRLTVPKDLAESFDLEGEQLDWTVKSGNTFELTRVDNE
jgi:ADP-dependent phosphofructokinase/glucokinase